LTDIFQTSFQNEALQPFNTSLYPADSHQVLLKSLCILQLHLFHTFGIVKLYTLN